MNWEYAEGNPFSDSSSGFLHQVQAMACALEALDPGRAGESVQRDAAELTVAPVARGVVCTEPPHADSLPLAELSDFFYAWLQPGLTPIHPDLSMLRRRQRQPNWSPIRRATAALKQRGAFSWNAFAPSANVSKRRIIPLTR
jgi:adenine-specific DNA methylase